MPDAAADILRTLEAFGFEWDGEVAYQSRRYDLYQDTPRPPQSGRAGVSLLLQPQRLAGGGNTWRRRICV